MTPPPPPTTRMPNARWHNMCRNHHPHPPPLLCRRRSTWELPRTLSPTTFSPGKKWPVLVAAAVLHRAKEEGEEGGRIRTSWPTWSCSSRRHPLAVNFRRDRTGTSQTRRRPPTERVLRPQRQELAPRKRRRRVTMNLTTMTTPMTLTCRECEQEKLSGMQEKIRTTCKKLARS